MSKETYKPEDAKRFFGDLVGQKYRPSNATEGDIFFSNYCDCCKHDIEQNCSIIAKTMLYDTKDEKYPHEWQYSELGQPICTKYEEKE